MFRLLINQCSLASSAFLLGGETTRGISRRRFISPSLNAEPPRTLHFRNVLLCWAAGILVFCNTDSLAQQSPVSPPPIRPMRQLEDYRYLTAAGNRQGAWWERLKYIPIGESPYAPFLTFGGEVRLRYELIDNTDFGSGPQDNGGYLLTRFMPYAALTLPSLPAGWELQLFAQFEAAFSD